MATEPAMRHTEMPAARITVSSLPRASEPRPSNAPISTAMGMSLVHLLREVQQHEPERIERRVGALADVVLLAGEQEQRAERQQHRQHDEHAAQHCADDVAVEQVHAGAAAGASAAHVAPITQRAPASAARRMSPAPNSATRRMHPPQA